MEYSAEAGAEVEVALLDLEHLDVAAQEQDEGDEAGVHITREVADNLQL